MALVVTHNSTADGDPLIDGDDWNANHTLTGGGTFRIPKHIETKTLNAGSTTTTFSSLDGDSDVEYLIIGDILIDASGDRVVVLKPNNTTSNQAGVRMYAHNSGSSGNVGYQAITSLLLTQNGWSKDSYNHFEATLMAASGKPRLFYSNSTEGIVTSYKGGNAIKAEWNDNSTNITSLVIDINADSFSGTIKLYKMVDLAI